MDIAKVVMAYLSLSNSNLKELISYEKSYKNKFHLYLFLLPMGQLAKCSKWGTFMEYGRKKSTQSLTRNFIQALHLLTLE